MPAASAAEIRERMSGNICRCSAYPNIVEAIMDVARRERGMKAFTYERASDIAAATKAASQPGASFIAGGTNLLDLMKLEIERPSHLVDVIAPAAATTIDDDAGRRPAHRRAGEQHRPRGRFPRPPRLSGAVARIAERRLGAAAQQGDHGGQSAAAHALPLLLRRRPCPATNASRAAAARRCRASTACMPSWAPATTASPSTRRTWRWR